MFLKKKDNLRMTRFNRGQSEHSSIHNHTEQSDAAYLPVWIPCVWLQQFHQAYGDVGFTEIVATGFMSHEEDQNSAISHICKHICINVFIYMHALIPN